MKPPDVREVEGDNWAKLAPGAKVARYKILGLLAVGGMGHVYAALDSHLQRKIAFKLLPRPLLQDRDRVRRFKQEARTASALNHPNIVTVHEIGKCDAGQYLVMELVTGHTLRHEIRQNPPIGRVLRIAVQCARALAVAHAAGIAHRDIKPENVMVREDGYVKVLDFGLARLAEPSVLTESNDPTERVFGSLRYMSPEHAKGETIGSASDVFSLGIVLYEMATGEHPFKAESSAFSTFLALASRPAVDPARINPQIPDDLASLIMAMLDRDASRRPDAAQVERSLEAILGAAGSSTSLAVFRKRRRSVGRHSERQELVTTFHRTATTCGALTCISGEPGLGKSYLVEDFLADLVDLGQEYFVGRGRCSERFGETGAYLPFLDALEDLLHQDRTGRVAAAMRLVAPTWYMQLASLEVDDWVVGHAMESRPGSRERLKREIANLVREMTKHKPVVLVFDNVQWADVSTTDLLGYLAGRFDNLRALLIVTYRPSDLRRAEHPFLTLKNELQTRGVCQEVVLRPFTIVDVQRYLDEEYPKHRFPSGLPHTLLAKTEGNPLFLADLLRYLRDHGAIVEQDGWALTDKFESLHQDVPASVRGMVQRKIDQLDEEGRRVLAVASVQGEEFDSAVLAATEKTDPGEVEDKLDALERFHGLVTLIGESEMPNRALTARYRFSHKLYQDAFYSSLRMRNRSELSASIARSLVDFYGDRVGDIAAQLASLFERGRDNLHGAQFSLQAALGAIAIFGHHEAQTLTRKGLEMAAVVPDSADRDRLELSLRSALGLSLCMTVGYTHHETQKCFTRAYELSSELGDEVQLFPAVWGLWIGQIISGQCEKARQSGEQLVRIADQTNDPAMRVAACYAVALALEMLGQLSDARQLCERGLSSDESGRHRDYVARFVVDPSISMRGVHVRVLWLLGFPDQAKGKLNDLLTKTEARGIDPRSQVDSLITAATYYQFCGEPTEATILADRARTICAEYGIPQEGQWALFILGWARAEQGHVDEGVAKMRSALATLTDAGAFFVANTAYVGWLAAALGRSGEPGNGLQLIASSLDFAAGTGHHYLESELYRVRADLLEALGADGNDIEASLRMSLHVAQGQRSKSLALRAALSLSRFLVKRRMKTKARMLLRQTYGEFTEGFETRDLREAQELLRGLS